ncbi:GNAT family N-acetyltransferase [bacterium]|nr:MAG: GNAT family N-acetyltransferase [bacterium]
MNFVVKKFDELSSAELYDILKLRQDVFIIEQQSIFEDLDRKDQACYHVLGKLENEIVAYARILRPGLSYDEASVGRIITSASIRGTNKGRELVRFSVDYCRFLYPGEPIRISAQQHLQSFYGEFGFTTDSSPYDDGGILHVEMILKND